MTVIDPVARYLTLAKNLRNRIESSEILLEADITASQKVEVVCLQGRKAIETLAYMCVTATHHGLGHLGIPREVKKHWNAETIFNAFQKKNIMVLPSPSRMRPSNDPRYRAIFEGVAESRLDYNDLIGIYRCFHKGLHEPNPYVQAEDSLFYKDLLGALPNEIARLRNFAWIHFVGIRGEGFAVDLKNSAGDTAVVPLSKVGAPIP